MSEDQGPRMPADPGWPAQATCQWNDDTWNALFYILDASLTPDIYVIFNTFPHIMVIWVVDLKVI